MIQTPIKLISQELFNFYSLTSKNLNPDKIQGFVILAQESTIKPLIGYQLYLELQEQIDTDTLTEENKLLLSELAQTLALKIDFLSLRSLAYQISEKGITKEKSDNTESLDSKELGELKIDILSQFELAYNNLINFLCCNKEKYPKWIITDCNLCDSFIKESTEIAEVTKEYNKILIGFPKLNFR